MNDLTLKGLEEMAYGTAKAAGWHERHGEKLTPDHAVAQLALLAPMIQAVSALAEAIRKPEKLSIDEARWKLTDEAEVFRFGLGTATEYHLKNTLNEYGHELEGSKAQILSWLVLIVTEVAEAMEAVLKGDKENFREEIADTYLRLGDDTGAINDKPDHFLGPIDVTAEILKKNERNRQRGYRHGGKRA